MTPDERKQAVKAMLDDDPSLSQWAIARRLGVSQRTVSRDMAAIGRVSANRFVANRPKAARPQTVSSQVSGGMTRAAPVTSITPEGIAALMDFHLTPGDKLVAAIRAELDSNGLEPDAREAGLLAQVRETADIIAAAQQRLDADGLVFAPAAKGGPPRPHPLLAEIRGQRVVLARLLSQINMEEGSKNPVKQKAANTRSRARNMQREAGIG